MKIKTTNLIRRVNREYGKKKQTPHNRARRFLLEMDGSEKQYFTHGSSYNIVNRTDYETVPPAFWPNPLEPFIGARLVQVSKTSMQDALEKITEHEIINCTRKTNTKYIPTSEEIGKPITIQTQESYLLDESKDFMELYKDIATNEHLILDPKSHIRLERRSLRGQKSLWTLKMNYELTRTNPPNPYFSMLVDQEISFKTINHTPNYDKKN